ncbi:MAG: sigma-70 family RNA polymerase sigma factor [Phycisphaerae bacterium]|nr:sigma-70 family RNA polymerase sigma factor [Phycisphaerae bacterium]
MAGALTADHELVSRCQDGDMTAFEGLVERYQDRVYNLVFRLSGRHEDAQDITQDVFLRALEHIADFRRQAQVYTWLFRIAVNLAISKRRRGQRVRFISLDAQVGGDGRDDGEPTSIEPPDSREESPPEVLERDERGRQVAQAVSELDEEFRSVLVLKDIEGFDYAQISEILDVPLGTVKSRLHRARNELKVKLRPIVPM